MRGCREVPVDRASRMRVAAAAGVGLLLLLTSGCGSAAEPVDEPADAPYVIGSVESMLHRATASSVVVRPPADAPDPCGIAATVDSQTRFFRRTASDESTSPALLADIQIGDSVEVYISGPVAESCPAQGYADRIILIGTSGL